jgi:adenylate cyclase class 2
MHIEYECTLLEINEEEFIKMLEAKGAKKIGEYFQRRYVYDFDPVLPDKWIRLRTNGTTTTLTIKKILDKNAIGGNKELEVEVDDFDTTNELLHELGYHPRGYQENKRITYVLDDVEFDIDSWPMIPTYVEIEGKDNASVEAMIQELNLDKSKITTLDVTSIYKDIYGIDILGMKELRF